MIREADVHADRVRVLHSGCVVALSVGRRLGTTPWRRLHQRPQVRDGWGNIRLPVGDVTASTWNTHIQPMASFTNYTQT